MRIHYRHKEHRDFPHVVKFSGGRSSAMMTLLLIEHGLLDPERGDVIVFNNTSAEHKRTYEFVIRCKQEVERRSDIPFLLTQFATYEVRSQRGGYWYRKPSFQLTLPVLGEAGNDMRWQGELFKQLVASKKSLPNRYQRSCTSHLKILVTSQFLAEWFSGGSHTLQLGHQQKEPQQTLQDAITHYQTYGGTDLSEQELEIFYSCIRGYPHIRKAQRYTDYMEAPRYKIPLLTSRSIRGKVPLWEKAGVEWINLLGLRHDEAHRVLAIRKRCHDDGSIPYTPLHDNAIDKKAVNSFWDNQEFDLQVHSDYSNCVLCFMKGREKLRRIAKTPLSSAPPAQLSWWRDLEERFARKANTGTRFGFFGKGAKIDYSNLLTSTEEVQTELPCFCTD